jgi:cytoplasmic iron level regulating protein YaaA (DUF328/UPF0246 family)
MLFALLSPAKRLDFKDPPAFVGKGALKPTQPALLKETAVLAARTRRYTRNDLRGLMEISPKLAELNYKRFQAFDPANKKDTKPAIYTFAGDVYMGFQAASLSADDIAFAQKHVGILSGLYGVLRPLDLIQAYRLEMGSAVDTARGKNLYDFWQDAVTGQVNETTAHMKRPTIINLASQEYWGAVEEKKLKAPVVHVVFNEVKNGKAQIVAFFAKKARGMMARYIVEHRLEAPEDLKAFDTAGYAFDAKASDDLTLVFSRKSVTP